MSEKRTVALNHPNRLVVQSFVEVQVVGKGDGLALPGVPAMLLLPNASPTSGVSDVHGRVRFAGLPLFATLCTIVVGTPPPPTEAREGHSAADEDEIEDDAEDDDDQFDGVEHAPAEDDHERACCQAIPKDVEGVDLEFDDDDPNADD